MKKSKTKDAIKILVGSKKIILTRLEQVVKTGSFNYRTFGTAIEDYISNILIEIFKKNNLIKSDKDYVLAPHKNYFPDFQLKTSPPLAIEYKSGNKSKISKEKWVSCKNSNNDMGTLNTWPEKIKKFGDKNIYYIFIIYNFSDRTKEILDVQIAPFYKFIGLNREGFIKYREKDGNLRPKDFYEKSPIDSFKQFDKLFKKTCAYRSRRVIKKHQKILRSLGFKR